MSKTAKGKIKWALALAITFIGLVIFAPRLWQAIDDGIQSAIGKNTMLISATAPQRLIKAPVVLRVKHLRDIGEGEYKVAEARVIAVFKNVSGERIGDTVKIASYYGHPGLPGGGGISTVYLEPYGPKDDLWMLMGGSELSGVSHTSYELSELLKRREPSQRIERPAIQCGSSSEASPSHLALEKTYRAVENKGKVMYGMRSTILTHKRRYKVGEPVMVFHVLESVRDGVEMPLGGPKPICSEYIDGILADNKKCRGSYSVSEQVVRHPIVNFNFDMSTYCFSEPGEHTISWKPWLGESNLITLNIEPK